MLADLVGGCACAMRSSSNPKVALARLVPPVTIPPSKVRFAPLRGANVAGSPNRTLFVRFYLIWVYLVLFVRSALIWTSHVYLKCFVRSGQLHYFRRLIRSGRWSVAGACLFGACRPTCTFFIVFKRNLCSEVKVLKTFCIYPRAEIDFFYNFLCSALPN